jgi:hypothetical protein
MQLLQKNLTAKDCLLYSQASKYQNLNQFQSSYLAIGNDGKHGDQFDRQPKFVPMLQSQSYVAPQVNYSNSDGQQNKAGRQTNNLSDMKNFLVDYGSDEEVSSKNKEDEASSFKNKLKLDNATSSFCSQGSKFNVEQPKLVSMSQNQSNDISSDGKKKGQENQSASKATLKTKEIYDQVKSICEAEDLGNNQNTHNITFVTKDPKQLQSCLGKYFDFEIDKDVSNRTWLQYIEGKSVVALSLKENVDISKCNNAIASLQKAIDASKASFCCGLF